MPKKVKIGEGRTLSRLATPLPVNWAGALVIGLALGIISVYVASRHK